MGDYTMSGGSDDPSITMGVNLAFENVAESSAQLDALISQTEDWRTSIEAVKSSLSDTYEVLSSLSDVTGNYRDVFQEVLDLSERHESVLRRSVDNAQALAAATRDMQGMFGMGMGLGGAAPALMGEVGQASGMFGGIGSATYGGPGMIGGAIQALETGGAPALNVGPGRMGGYIGNILETAATNQYWMSGGMGPGIGGAHPLFNTGGYQLEDELGPLPDAVSAVGGTEKRSVSTRVPTGISERENLVNKTLNIPYYLPGGRLAALARFVNNVTYNPATKLGLVTGLLSKQTWLYGEEGPNPNMVAELENARALRIEQLMMQARVDAATQIHGEYPTEARINSMMIAPEQEAGIREAVAKMTAVQLGVRSTKIIKPGLLGAEGSIANYFTERFGRLAGGSGWGRSATGYVNQHIDEEYIQRLRPLLESAGVTDIESALQLPGAARSSLGAAEAEAYAARAGLTEAALGAAGTGASLAAIGTAATALAAPFVGYKAYSAIAQRARQYSAATGEADMGAAFGGYLATRVGAFSDSFLSAGLMDSKTAMEIRMGAEQTGFRRGGGYYNDFVSGAKSAYQTFGIDPNEYMQMFQDSVVNAKNSMLELNGSIETLGRMAAKSNTSFEVLRKTYNYYSQSLYQAGMQGGVSNAIAMAGAGYWANNPQMQGYGSSIGLLSSKSGIMLASMAAGTNPLDYYNIVRTSGGQMKMAMATDDAVLSMLANGWGLTPGMPDLENAIGRAEMEGLLEWITQSIPNPNGKDWTPDTARQYVRGLLTGTKSVAQTMASQATQKLEELTGRNTDRHRFDPSVPYGAKLKPYSKIGLQNFFENLSGVQDKRGSIQKTFGATLGLIGYHSGITVYKDPNINNGEIIKDPTSLSLEDQIQLRRDLQTESAYLNEMGINAYGTGGKLKRKWRTLGKATGVELLGNAAAQSQLSMSIDIKPEVKKFFNIIGNTSAYQNTTIRNSSRAGYSSNTSQDPNASSMGYDFGIG